MPKLHVIGIAGQAGSGKNCAADHLIHKLNESDKFGRWEPGSFASNVKRIFSETFGVTQDFIEHWKRIDSTAPGLDMPLREALTFIGDGFRKIRSTVWMDLLLNDRKSNLVLSDLRYYNEADRVRKEGGTTVLVWRPGHENNIPNPSEQQLKPLIDRLKEGPEGVLVEKGEAGEVKREAFDIFIKNDGNIEELFAKLDKYVIPYVMQECSKT